MRLTNSKAMRDADSRAIHVLGIPSTLLMTNAAGAVASEALALLAGRRSAVCFCGSGNNGGDGVAAACFLLRRGVSVRCFLVGERSRLTEDCAEMERRLKELGGALEDFDRQEAEKSLPDAGVIIDALFGIGLSRPIEGEALEAVRLINSAACPVVSADIASGVEADTGRILGEAVNATVTVTFSLAKPGHFVEPGCTRCGRLVIADIGLPAELLAEAQTDIFAVFREEISLPKRPKLSHKGDYGRLLIIGGSEGYTGAPEMCAKAACRAGAGLVSLGVPGSIYQITAAKLSEPMPFALPCDSEGKISLNALEPIMEKLGRSDCAVIGCGLGRSEELSDLVGQIVEGSESQLVLDADGLYALKNGEKQLKNAKKAPILTPHEGEFARLCATQTGDRIADARDFARSKNCVLVLKGHHTLCAFPDGEVYIIPYGNPGMAKGGSGDVLAGIIGAFAMQLPLKKAVVTACAVHALAGDACCERLGEYSMLPTDLIEALPEVTKEIIS